MENQQEQPVFRSARDIWAQLFQERVPTHDHLKRFRELEGDQNLPLISDGDRPASRVEVMSTLLNGFNMTTENKLLGYLFEKYSQGLPLQRKTYENQKNNFQGQ